MSPLRVRKADRHEDGDCNFCNADNYRVVYEVSSSDCTLVVRFCRACLNKLEKAKYL